MEGEGLISGSDEDASPSTLLESQNHEVLDEADKAPIEVVVILKALVEAIPACRVQYFYFCHAFAVPFAVFARYASCLIE